jgi:hypothetical protein
MKVHVVYTDFGCPRIKEFEDMPTARTWAGEFLFDHKENQDDYTIDAIFEGNLVYKAEWFEPKESRVR